MLYAEFVKYYNVKDFEALELKFKKIPEEEIKSLIKGLADVAFNEESLIFVKAILFLYQRNLVNNQVISILYEEGIKQLQRDDLNQKLLTELLCILSKDLSKLSSKTLAHLCQLLLDTLKLSKVGFGLSFKLFQKLVDIFPQHSIVIDCDQVTTGAEYRKTILKRICLCDWHDDARIHIISTIREFALSAVESDTVTKKIISELSFISLQELPPFIFQALAFANSFHKSHVILEAIVQCTNNIINQSNQDINHDNASITVCETEGTILLYIANSIKQNLLLGRSMLKMLKNVKTNFRDKLVSPFFLALCLLLVQDGRFTEDALSSLRSVILKCYQDEHRRNSFKYMQEHTKKFQNIQEMLFCVANKCTNGWSCIVSGLIQLGFSLMAAFGPKKCLFGKVTRDLSKAISPQTQASKVGLTIVSMSFKASKFMRTEIIKTIVKSIRSNINNLSHHYLKLFASITKSYPQSVLLSLHQLKMVVDDLPLMQIHDALKLFQALLPLLKICPDLRSSLILALRKMLSSRMSNTRACAVSGFLLFLRSFPVVEMTSLSQLSSQSSQSIFSSASTQGSMQHSTLGQAHNRMLCMEIIQALKKCLTQQCNIRVQLYKGFIEVATVNPQLSSTIIEIISEHFLMYYEDNSDIIPPVCLKSCISKADGNIQEPLPLLLATISFIVTDASNRNKTDDDDMIFDEEMIMKWNEVFNSIYLRLCKCEVDDFIGTTNNEQKFGSGNVPILVLSLHQVLIQHWMMQDNVEKAVETYQSYKKLHEQFGQSKIGNFEKSLSESLYISSTFKTTAKMVFSILSDDSEWTANENFVKHIMLMLHNVLMQISEHGVVTIVSDVSKQSFFNDLSNISRLCLHKFLTEKNTPDQCTILLQCIDCFHLSAKIISTWYPSKLIEFYSSVYSKEASHSQSNHLIKVINQLQRSIIAFVSTGDPLSAYEKKILSELLALLDTLLSSALASCDYSNLEQLADWFQKLCLEYQIEDNLSLKRAIHLFLTSSLHLSNHPVLPVRDLSSDIRINLESAKEVDSQPTYKIISPFNSQILVPILIKHIEHIMADCDWLLGYIKACCLSYPLNDIDEAFSESRRKAEGMICGRICTIGVGLLDLLTGSIEAVPAVESIITGLNMFFNFLIQLSKYYLWLCSQSVGTIPSRFEKLISFIGSEMMRPVYAFIMHAESVQSNCLTNKNNSKKSSKVSTSGRAKILRESKSISQLVYSIEQHEHHLILLTRKSKLELMKDYHLSTARDFRIRTDAIHVSLNDQEMVKDKGNESSEDDEEKENQDEPISSASKRCRLDS